MPKHKQTEGPGVTRTEKLLAELCSKSFLRLWSYANPYKDDRHEFCDIIAAFEDHVFVFFDREKKLLPLVGGDDPIVRWERWKREVVEAQIRTAHGAERYLRSGRKLFLDAKGERPFPLSLNPTTMIIHKIVVAHGAAEACRSFSDENLSGSLAVSYGGPGVPLSLPFMLNLNKYKPIHVLDSSSLPIIFSELDTVRDFANYLEEKIRTILKLDFLVYCGEEDLLATYLLNTDRKTKKHFIAVQDDEVNGLNIAEGMWEHLRKLPQYQATKDANANSYFWDELIDKTCKNFQDGVLLGDNNLLGERSAIREMAKEPRFFRRAIVDHIREAVSKFPADPHQMRRHMRYFQSYDDGRAYVFLQLWVPPHLRGEEEVYRGKRQQILGIACGSAKNKMLNLHTVVGILIEPPKLSDRTAEDFLLLDCTNWDDERREHFETLNKDFDFFQADSLSKHRMKVPEFVHPKAPQPTNSRVKLGRNDPCPCGSGKKFKKCHGVNL